MAPQLPVTLIMGQDLRIGKASVRKAKVSSSFFGKSSFSCSCPVLLSHVLQQEALRTFGYHPHELVNQKLAFYLPSKGEFTGSCFITDEDDSKLTDNVFDLEKNERSGNSSPGMYS